jgi:hypothetical protein
VQVREQIANRLITGPPRDDFDPDREISEETLSYWRDHEIARVVDNNQDVPGTFLDLIRDRRASDTDFPDDVPAVETGASGLRFQGVPDGDPKAFSNVSDANLIAALANATRDRPFGEGNNAEAYARKNRRRLVDLLAQRKNTDEDTATVWELALSYPHDKPDDVEDARPTAERIAKRALEMHDELFERVLDQLCYWLDATDELLKDFSGAALLWERLLPVSARRENTQIMSDAANEADLSSAALNVPLGHLISFFL